MASLAGTLIPYNDNNNRKYQFWLYECRYSTWFLWKKREQHMPIRAHISSARNEQSKYHSNSSLNCLYEPAVERAVCKYEFILYSSLSPQFDSICYRIGTLHAHSNTVPYVCFRFNWMCSTNVYGFERKCNRIEQFRYVKLNVWSLGRALVSQLKPYDALVILLCQIQCFFVVQLEPN